MGGGFLNSLLRQSCVSLCCCHDYFLERFARDKDWLFILLLLLLPFQRASRRLTVNPSTGAHLALILGNAKRRLAGCKCPTWSPSISYLSKFNNLFILLNFLHPGNPKEIRYLSYLVNAGALYIDVRIILSDLKCGDHFSKIYKQTFKQQVLI